MSSSSNSFLRAQRKSDLLVLAETVGLKEYVQNLSLIKLSRPSWIFFATRELAPPPVHRLGAGPAGGAVASRPCRMAVVRLSTDARLKAAYLLPGVTIK